MRLLVAFVMLIVSTGCPKGDAVRNVEVYKAELSQWDNWATRQASYLRDMVEKHCECDGPKFADSKCEEMVDWILTIESRHEWHKQMALYNAYLIEEEPSNSPPEIPPSSCPPPPKED